MTTSGTDDESFKSSHLAKHAYVVHSVYVWIDVANMFLLALADWQLETLLPRGVTWK